MAAARAKLSKKEYKALVKEEVAIAIQVVLKGDAPFKYTQDAQKTYRCAECGGKFHKVVWFQLFCSRSCGSRRSGRVSRRYHAAFKTRRS